MKISDLSQEQLLRLADNRPEWMADHRPYWMAENHPDWMEDNRPEWMADNRPDWGVAHNRPEWMVVDNRRGEEVVPKYILELLELLKENENENN